MCVLHYSTLRGFKRLIEVVEDGGGTLSVVLAGHPKLKNDLRRPTMEEIGYRATVFSLEGIVGSQREYIEWLVSKCTTEDTPIGDMLPWRWILERTFAWLGRYRRLSIDYEALPASSEAFIYAAMVHIMLRQLA